MKIKIIASAVMLFILALSAIGCTPVLGQTPTIPSGPNKPWGSDVVIPNWDLVEEFIKNSSTYRFDGIAGSIKLVNATSDAADRTWEFTVEFQTRHAGHGDRTGRMMAEVITNHAAAITVTNGEITSAVCDKTWDMLKDSPASAPGPDIKASLGQEFILPIGQSAEIAGEDLTVKFVDVTGDSRSPKGAETIWAGEAKCRIQVSYQGATSEITLTEKGGSEGYTLVPVLQYNLNFQLQPYPEVGKQPANSDYTLRLKITK